MRTPTEPVTAKANLSAQASRSSEARAARPKPQSTGGAPGAHRSRKRHPRACRRLRRRQISAEPKLRESAPAASRPETQQSGDQTGLERPTVNPACYVVGQLRVANLRTVAAATVRPEIQPARSPSDSNRLARNPTEPATGRGMFGARRRNLRRRAGCRSCRSARRFSDTRARLSTARTRRRGRSRGARGAARSPASSPRSRRGDRP